MKIADSTKILILIGLAIQAARKSKGLSQSKLGKLCGMEKASISRLESGKSNITILKLQRVAKALHVSLSQLVETDIPNKS